MDGRSANTGDEAQVQALVITAQGKTVAFAA